MITKVDVVMATFNGEKYIREQFMSILNQSVAINKIIICDDCSTDNTIKVIEDIIKAKKIFNVEILKNKVNIGPTRTFLKVINESHSEFIILADQDDIWLENKVYQLLQGARNLNSSKPGVFFSNLDLINSEGIKIGKSFWQEWEINPKKIELRKIITGNIIPGCSMIINNKMKEILSKNNIDEISFHDHFILLISTIYKNFDFSDESLMLYRSHNTNFTTKQKRNVSFIKSLISKFIWNSPELGNNIKNAKVLLEVFEKDLGDEDKVYIRKFIELPDKNNFLKKLFVTFCSRNWRKYPTLNRLILAAI